MDTMKKLTAFLIILLMLGAVLFLFAGSWILELIVGDEGVNAKADKLIMGEDGSVYLFSVEDGQNVLIRLHGDGRIERRWKLPGIEEAGQHHVSSVFCSADGHIFVSAYRVNEAGTGITSSDLYLIPPYQGDVRLLRSVNCDEGLYYEAMTNHHVADMRDSGAVTLLLAADDGVYTVLAYDHATDEFSAGASFTGPGACPTGLVLDRNTILLGQEGGSVLRYDALTETLTGTADPEILLSRFMWTEGGVYFIEGRTGSLGMIDGETGAASSIVNGPEPMPYMIDLTGYRLFDMNGAGQFALMTDDDLLYTGTDDTFLMTLVDTSVNHAQASNILKLIAVLLGLLLASGVVWYLYVYALKMYLPIMVRQCIAVVFIVGVLMNLFLTWFIAVDMTATVEEELKNRMVTMAALFGSGLETQEEDFWTDVDDVTNLLARNGFENEQLGFALYEQDASGSVFIRGSSSFFEAGMNVDSPALEANMIHVVQEAYRTGQSIGFYMDRDTTLAAAFVRLPKDPNWIAEVFVTHNRMTAQIQEIFVTMYLQFTLTSLVLIALLLISQSATVRGIRRLSRGVKLLADGDMNVMVVQRTGDEVETLAHAFNAMASELSETFARMEALNRSYFRFVPEQLVSLLGAGSIEGLDKSSHIRRDMGVMVIKFGFDGDDGSRSTDELFADINEVIERTSCIVTKNGGMAYDFACDGFNAVFEKDPGKMASTAIAIRQEILSLNEERRGRGEGAVRLAVALDQGSVMLGMVGDEDRLAPTAISSAIVDARRIVKLCGRVDASILCTGEVAAGARCEEGMRCIGSGDLGGRQRVLHEIFEGDPYAIRNAKRASKERFARAVELFGARRYAEAKQIFLDIVKLEQGDGVARRYLYLADQYAVGGKPEEGL